MPARIGRREVAEQPASTSRDVYCCDFCGESDSAGDEHGLPVGAPLNGAFTLLDALERSRAARFEGVEHRHFAERRCDDAAAIGGNHLSGETRRPDGFWIAIRELPFEQAKRSTLRDRVENNPMAIREPPSPGDLPAGVAKPYASPGRVRSVTSPAPVGTAISRAESDDTPSAHLPSGDSARAAPSPRRTAGDPSMPRNRCPRRCRRRPAAR